MRAYERPRTKPIGDFVDDHPTIKILALSFLILIGVLVVVIRTWGGYPDGVAFAVLLMNMAAPLIDRFTRPRIFGHD